MIKTFYENSNKEIIKGGRYDINWDGYGEVIPAIGFSVDIDELLRKIYIKEEI
jgi:ATP phosphoribosyltransferase regulatory subunit